LSAQERPPQIPCGKKAQMITFLQSKHNETLYEGGPTNHGGSYVGLFRKPDGSSWTIAVVYLNGMMCLLTAGEDWKSADQPKLKEGGPRGGSVFN